MKEAYQKASIFLLQTKADIQIKKMEEQQRQLVDGTETIVKDALDKERQSALERERSFGEQIMEMLGYKANQLDAYRKELKDELRREPTLQEIFEQAKAEKENNEHWLRVFQEDKKTAGIG